VFVESYMDAAESKDKGIDWFAKNNPSAALYLSGAAAQDLGLRLPGIESLERKDVQKKVREAKENVRTEKESARKSTEQMRQERTEAQSELQRRRSEVTVVTPERAAEAQRIENKISALTRMIEERETLSQPQVSPVKPVIPKTGRQTQQSSQDENPPIVSSTQGRGLFEKRRRK